MIHESDVLTYESETNLFSLLKYALHDDKVKKKVQSLSNIGIFGLW